MERFKLWLLSLFIKDLASVLRQFHKLVDRLDNLAERELAKAEAAQLTIGQLQQEEIAARNKAVEALRVRDKIKENFL